MHRYLKRQIQKSIVGQLGSKIKRFEKIMEGLGIVQKDHSQFIALVTAKIAKFSSQMVEILLTNLDSNSKIKKTTKNGNDQDEQYSKESDCPQKKDEVKRKYSKSRTILPLDTDPFRPKLPSSSFLIYYNENKKELTTRFGEDNSSKLTKLASQVWKQLPEQQKKKYQKLSQESKERYQKQMADYKAKYADKNGQNTKKRKTEYRLTQSKVNLAILKEKESQNNLFHCQLSKDDGLK